MYSTMAEEINPILRNLQELGCSSHFKLSVAYHVFIDLHEVRQLDVQSKYNKDLDIIYFEASGEKLAEESEIFIPLSSASFLSMGWIETIQDSVCQGREKPRITLAFREQDSSVMYYCMTKGIVPPDPPPTSESAEIDSSSHHSSETNEPLEL